MRGESRMREFVLTFAILSVLAAGSASAEEVEDFVGRSGWFVGLSGVLGGVADDDVDHTTSVAGGFSIRAGHRLHPLVAAEVQLEFLDNLVDRSERSDIDVWTMTANAKRCTCRPGRTASSTSSWVPV